MAGFLVTFPLAFVFAAIAETRQSATVAVATTVLGAAWVGFGLGHLVLIRELDEVGVEAILTVLVTVFAIDTFAYAGGRLAGRHRMTPVMSPNKTWEGFVFGAVAGILAAFFALYSSEVYGSWRGLVLGAALVAASTVGDLFESLVKRDLGAKDTGRLLREHGGVLDRVDSLLFAAPGRVLRARRPGLELERLPDPPEPERANGAGVHEGLLERLARHSTKRSVEVRRLLEPKLAEASTQARQHRLARVEATVLLLPGRERRCDRRRHVVEASGGLEGELLAQVPVGGVSVHALPSKFDQDHASARPQKACMRSTAASRSWMWWSERLATTRIERSGFVELLQGRPAEERTVRSLGIDRDHVVPRLGERKSELPGTAPDLEHASRRGRKLREHERGVHGPYRGTGGPTRVSTLAA